MQNKQMAYCILFFALVMFLIYTILSFVFLRHVWWQFCCGERSWPCTVLYWFVLFFLKVYECFCEFLDVVSLFVHQC